MHGALRLGMAALGTLTALLLWAAARAEAPALPPLAGAVEPRIEPFMGDDGFYHQSWFTQSFLDLREDHAEAKAKGQRLAVIFEQRGCIHCARMHTEVLSERYINDYVRENFSILQLDLWGAREVTDFDGTRLTEKKLAGRWGVLFTPTVVFFKESVSGEPARWGASLEVARLPLSFGSATFIDLFGWIRARIYETDPDFRRFHVARMRERELAAGQGAKDKVN